jgi:PAS domain S-box-containing protein
MTIRVKAFTGLLVTLLLAVISGVLVIYIQQQDARLLAEAARTTHVLQLHADLKSMYVDILAGRQDVDPDAVLAALGETVRDPQQRLVLTELNDAFARGAMPAVGTLLQRFEQRQRDISTDAQRQIAVYRRSAQQSVIALEVGILAIVLLAFFAIHRSVLVPLARLTEAASSLTYGGISQIEPVQRSDEVGLLTNALARMVRTVSEREEELRSRHRELETTLETVPAAFILVDANGRVRVQNRAATALIGPPPKDSSALAHYRASFRLVARDGTEIPADQWPLARALQGETILSQEVEIRTATTTLPMLVASAPIRSDGRIDGAVVAFQDVSALRDVDRLKDEFVSIVSHELRTPLTSIRGSLQLVLDDPQGIADPDQQQLLNVALNNCERLIRIINDILDVSKIEAGRMQLQLTPTAVAQVVHAAAQVVGAVARSAQVQLAIDIDEGLPAIDVEADRLVQALVNLISNAVKFAPAESTVTVRATRHGTGEVAISVQDRGPGIAPDDLARLFQKFQQVDASASRRKGGTGLGLVIAKALIEQHAGRVEVQSVVGEGSRFTIVLPASTSTAPAALPAPRRGTVTHGRTVLVVDDDDEFRLVVRRHLEKAGYRVVEAREGAAGLHVAREVRPDAITIDLMMPGMNGWDLLARLSTDPELSSIPVVIVSAVADQAGPMTREVSVLAKPVSPDQLLAELGVATGGPDATVLVAEDDADVRNVISRTLARKGYRVLVAQDGAEALAVMESATVHLLVLDVKMPNVDGLAVLQRLRATAATQDVPVIMVSGSDEHGELRFRAVKLGADAYLPKPIDAGELARRIEQLVARSA